MSKKVDIGCQFSIGEIYDYYEIIAYVSEEFTPEEVFNDDVLRNWAEDNGFVEEE